MSDTPPNPKSFHLVEGDTVGFEGQAERVSVVWPHSSKAPEEMILNALEDAGALFSNRELAGDVISACIETHGDKRAAESLVMLFSRLPGGRRGDELRAAMLGTVDDESISETSARHGVCKITWFKAIQRLRRRLFGKTANDPDYL